MDEGGESAGGEAKRGDVWEGEVAEDLQQEFRGEDREGVSSD